MASTDIGPEEEKSLNYSPSSPVCYLRYDGGTELKVMEKPSDSISNALGVSGTDVTPHPPTAATTTSNIEKPFSPDKYTLFHSPGVGSTHTLALLILLSIPHDLVTLDYEFVSSRTSSDPESEEHANSPDVRRLLRANKLAQFPTLVTPEGVVVTEMAGIALYLQERHAKGTPWSLEDLSPEQLAVFYRIMLFIPANIYPTITAIDFPERFITIPPTTHILEHISAEAVVGWVGERAIENRIEAFLLLERILGEAVENVGKEGEGGSVFALGTKTPTIVDVYVTLVAHYSPRPRFSWLQSHCPRIFALSNTTLEHPVLRKVFREADFGDVWPGLEVEGDGNEGRKVAE